jgi:hypothetical protein
MPFTKQSYLGLPPLTGQESYRSVPRSERVPLFNGHIHTPFSFSAFRNMEEPFQMAREEGISALGINDFYTTGGYAEFAALSREYRIFPLFNIEFMALQKEEQQSGIRVNDPVNPGRTYISGKGLRFPVKMNDSNRRKLERLQTESNRQTYEMVEKLNHFLSSLDEEMQLDPAAIQKNLARNLLRERHIASALRIAIEQSFSSEADQLEFYQRIFQGKPVKSPLNQVASLENEIRNNLLKAGGPAYVEEDEKAFLSLPGVTGLIIDAGGIPCYPVLLDDASGAFTDFEKEWPEMADRLIEKKIFMLELIPGRNDFTILKEFVRFFDRQGFVITFGTEHNTPKLDPLTVSCRGGVPLDRELLEINYRGVAVIAAHQYLTASGTSGFPTGRKPSTTDLDELEQLGKNIISIYTTSPLNLLSIMERG